MTRIRLKGVIIVVLLLICIKASAQPPDADRVVRYGYDFAGNRISREVVYIENDDQKASQVEDSINGEIKDSANTLAFDQNGNGNEGLLGEDETNANSDGQLIQIFPNPTSGSIQVKISPFNSSERNEFLFFDMQGHLLQKGQCLSEITMINLTDYSTGSYILRVMIAGKPREWEIIKR